MLHSWYIQNQCVDAESLQPISLIFIGIVIQMAMNSFMFALNLESDYKAVQIPSFDITQDTAQRDNRKSALHWANPKSLIFLWQFVFVVVLLVLDTLKLIDKIPKFESHWDRYQCFATILLTSSNSKTLFSYLFVIGIANTDKFPRLQRIGLFPGISKTKALFIISCCCLAFLELVAIWPYCIGLLVYLWIVIAMSLLSGIILLCLSQVRCLKCDVSYDANCHIWLLANTVASVYMFCTLLLGLAMVNLYSGMDYMDALIIVFRERNWMDYLGYVQGNTMECIRLVTWIL